MIPYITTLILISIVVILWTWRKTSSKSKIKLDLNSEVKDNNETKYLFKGLGFLFITVAFTYAKFVRSKNSADSNETIFDQIYLQYGSPKSKNPKATFFVKYFRSTLVFPKDYNAVKAFLCNNSCSDRFPKNITEHYFRGRGKGILHNSGDEAKELRRYTMKTLGYLGFGKNHRMSEILNEQLTDLLENLESQLISTNNKIKVRNLFTSSAISIVWSIIGGEKFAHNDPTLLFLYENVEKVANVNFLAVLLMDYFSQRTLLRLDIFGLGIKKMFGALDILLNYFHSYIKEKKLRMVATDPVDFVEYFLLEMEKHRLNEQLNKIYCENHLAYVLYDLFAAGMDTTSKYMECAFMFMALNPNVQLKVQGEIDSVIGMSTPMCSVHRKRMLFTEATIMEIHRMANIVPFAPRMFNRDTDIDSQHFEKGTFVMANFYFFRIEESYWGDPKVFRPERFLDSEKNLIADKMNHVIPFGAGPRACLGESVATASIFVFFTGILQRYSVVRSDPNEFLGLNKGFVPVSHPEPFHVSLIHRNI